MIYCINGSHARANEDKRGNYRANRKSTNPANPMTARAAVSDTRAESDHNACHDQGTAGPDDSKFEHLRGKHPQYEPACEQSGDKCSPPKRVVFSQTDESTNNAADPRNFSVEQKHSGSTQANKYSPEQGRNGCEIFHRQAPKICLTINANNAAGYYIRQRTQNMRMVLFPKENAAMARNPINTSPLRPWSQPLPLELC
jgi:hypothetical protein